MLSLLEAADRFDACAWETFKSTVQETAIRLGTVEAADKRALYSPGTVAPRALPASLTATLMSLFEAEEDSPGVFRDDIPEVKRQLLDTLESRHTGALMRSCELRFDYEEMPHKFARSFDR